jgi:protoheme ferro-lyase
MAAGTDTDAGVVRWPTFIGDYHLDPGWIAAVSESIRAHRARHGNAAHLVFSFHGLPQRLADNGDPYPRQCEPARARSPPRWACARSRGR